MAEVVSSPVVTVTTASNKWFKAGDSITLMGTVTDPAAVGIQSVTVDGQSATLSGNNWAYTFTHHDDTAGTSCTVVGTDNNSNFGTASYILKVDTVAPVISGVIATAGYDKDGVRWYKLNSEATIRATVTDATSGVKECKVHGESYTSGASAVIDTTNETSAESYTFTAMDVAGNTVSSTPFVVGVDGTGPTIAVKQYPQATIWTDMVSVTASASDAGGSGVWSLQYCIDGGRLIDYTSDIVVRENCTITLVATDNVGNVTTQDYEVQNIDEYPPVFTEDADTQSIVESTTFSVVAVDEETGLKSLSYSLDGETWIGYTSGDKIKVTSNHLTYTFCAEDAVGNVSFQIITFNNIYSQAEREKLVDLSESEFEIQSGDLLTSEMVVLSDGATLTLNETSGLAAQTLVLNGATLDATKGVATAHSLKVEGGDNTIIGSVGGIGIASMQVANGANLSVSKDQFDDFMEWRRFRSEGKIFVTASSGNLLTQDELDTLIKYGTVRSVTFDQALIGFNKLSFTENSTLIIGFAGGVGTTASDSITVKKGANIELGTAGTTLDFLDGKNTVAVKANAQLVMHSDVLNVASVKIDAGKTTKVNGVSGQNYTFADFATVEFSNRYNAVFSLGKFTNVTAKAIIGNEKSDKITIGSNAEAALGNISHIRTVTLSAGSKYKIASTDTEKTQGITKLTADSITVDQALKLTLNKFTSAWVEKIVTGGKNDSISVATDAKFVASYVYLEGGNDKIAFKKNSTGVLGDVDMGSGSNTLSLSSGADVAAESLDKVTKLTLSAGSYSKKSGETNYTTLNVVGNFTATSGNDTISIGKLAQVNVRGDLNMAGGKDHISIGNDAVVVLKSSSAYSITKFTIGKNSEVFLSTELCLAVTKVNSSSVVHDIGDWDTAKNFTSLAEETSDDHFAFARETEIGDELQGWLGSGLDEIDYFQVGDATTLTWSAADGVELKLWSASGSSIVATGTEIDLTGYAAFSMGIAAGQEEESFAYTAKLA